VRVRAPLRPSAFRAARWTMSADGWNVPACRASWWTMSADSDGGRHQLTRSTPACRPGNGHGTSAAGAFPCPSAVQGAVAAAASSTAAAVQWRHASMPSMPRRSIYSCHAGPCRCVSSRRCVRRALCAALGAVYKTYTRCVQDVYKTRRVQGVYNTRRVQDKTCHPAVRPARSASPQRRPRHAIAHGACQRLGRGWLSNCGRCAMLCLHVLQTCSFS
jgi:hypothetical protein